MCLRRALRPEEKRAGAVACQLLIRAERLAGGSACPTNLFLPLSGCASPREISQRTELQVGQTIVFCRLSTSRPVVRDDRPQNAMVCPTLHAGVRAPRGWFFDPRQTGREACPTMRDDSLFTTGARQHLRLLLRSIRSLADRLDRQFRAVLRQSPYANRGFASASPWQSWFRRPAKRRT